MKRSLVGAGRVALVALALAGCSRAVTVQTAPERTYSIEVRNTMPYAMVVSYDDGTGVRLLGTVGASQTEHFVLAGARTEAVTIIAVDEDRTRTVRKSIVLRPGSTVHVSLEG
jgi:hypothetical protein